MLKKEDILKKDDRKTIVIDVPEWNDKVKLREMSGMQRDAFEQSIIDEQQKTDMKNIRAKLCAKSIVDEDGNLMFTDKEVAKLGEKSGKALNRIYDAASELNGIGEAEVEKIEKNSETLRS